ncbi:hypothetical protein CFC21_059901 [Triticum aestivum]|uniref:DUF4220 domain-containing protein n=2 Tax=Triticum aestivum TaxID=4565 RepID=A0A3B6IYC5_WHEAT|nr:hypothetical protein CFC21_059901 [Triticum aestivum]
MNTSNKKHPLQAWLAGKLHVSRLQESMDGWISEFPTPVRHWSIRVGVLYSLCGHLLLVLTAGRRRHEAFALSPLVATVLADGIDKFVITLLFISDKTSREQQLSAFWLPFLLIHISRPDNISGFSIEENVFSPSQMLSADAAILGASNALYVHVIRSRPSAGTLVPASFLMYALGIFKYLERINAQRRGNLNSIKILMKMKNQQRRFSFHHTGVHGPLDNDQALLVAHSMLPITKCAFCDCSVDMDPNVRETGRKILSCGWESMCKVVEMELSLMYDLIYTKATVIHVWPGYIIRIVSPLIICAMLFLLTAYDKESQTVEDIVITYILVVSTLLLDVRWLLGALGSTWAYTFFKESRWQWLKHAVVCDGRWHRLRTIVVSMSSRFDMKQPSSYRLWRGIMGQYNLLHECTRHNDNPISVSSMMGLFYLQPQESMMQHEYHDRRGFRIPQDLKGLLFERIWEKLKLSYTPGKVQEEEVVQFDPDELQELILIWHMATDIFLQKVTFADEKSQKYVKLISKLSNYLVFLVVVCPNMLPVRKLPSKYEETNKALRDYLSDEKRPPSCKTREQKIAFILEQMGDGNSTSSIVLSDGNQYAGVLRSCFAEGGYIDLVEKMGEKSRRRFKKLMPGLCSYSELVTDEELLLNLIFDAWVLLLMNASKGSSRDSHAKQLGHGGDLVTIVWIMTIHANIFGIQEENNGVVSVSPLLLHVRRLHSGLWSNHGSMYGSCRLLSVNQCNSHEVRRVAAPLHW